MTNENSIPSEVKSAVNWGKFVPVVLLVGLLLLAGFALSRQFLQSGRPQSVEGAISAKMLEEQYGLRINLLAVTAVGGLVDLRLKVVDAEKAKILLRDSSNAPTLLIEGEEAVLTAPEESTLGIFDSLEDDGNIFLIYPNVGNMVKPNIPVTVQFGDVRLEPMRAQ